MAVRSRASPTEDKSRIAASAVRPLSAWREDFEQAVRLAIDAEDPSQSIQMVAEDWPGLRRARMVSPLTARMARSARMLSDGEDSVCLIINTGGALALRQLGREVAPAVGEGVLLSYREPATIELSGATYLAVRVPSAVIAAGAENKAARLIESDTDAMGLLRGYLSALPPGVAESRLRLLAAQHLYDLVALATGTRGCQTQATSVRAARLEAMKAALTDNPTLSLAEMARRLRVSERYVQMLFEEAGLTFSGFALDCRLDRAKAMLTSPRYDNRSIASIAYDAGFADLSYFNRRFRRRYLENPSHFRTRAKSDQDGQQLP
jgi:AraC-like DNA-binding protein